jgi:C1A family cysteine protease
MKMLGLFATASAAISGDVMSLFLDFQKTYGKSYSDAEFPKRLAIFSDNLERVNKLNAEHILLGGEAVHGVTQFLDLTPQEFKAIYLTYVPGNETDVHRPRLELDGPLASTVDWRTKGAVTAVKDQGQCGSCWAFSATEAIESFFFLKTGKLVELSPQQITSCDKVDGGCNGGWPYRAYDYVKSAGGMELGKDYPYTSGTSGQTGTCKFVSSKVVAGTGLKAYTSIQKSESQLQTALNNGPVSVCVAADAFQSYRGGILKSCPGQIDHCVQAVGYDSTNNYWIVRNSWATTWGEQGYIRIAMGKDLCQIAQAATFPTW